MMSTNFEQYVDQKVNLTATPDGATEAVTVEGVIRGASAAGIVFRAKGQRADGLYLASQIEKIEPLTAGPTKLKARNVAPVKPGRFREHLVLNHGYKLSEISDWSEPQAEEFHKGLDHSDLGHVHRELGADAVKAEPEDSDDDDE